MLEKFEPIPDKEMPSFETPTFDEYPELGQQEEVSKEKFEDLFPFKRKSREPETRSLYFDSKGNLTATPTDQEERQQRFSKQKIEAQFKPEDWKKLLKKEDKEKYISELAPKLPEKDFLNDVGEHVDFSSAQNIEQLIRMVENQKYIINGIGERVPADIVTDLIYDRVLNRQSFNKDWTKITLRHRLRETAYRLAEEYMQRPEFAGLANLDLEKINSVDNLKIVLQEHDMLPDINGKMLASETIIKYIEVGRFDLLPMPLQYKVKHLQKQNTRQQDKVINTKLDQMVNTPTLKDRFSNTVSRFTSWLKR